MLLVVAGLVEFGVRDGAAEEAVLALESPSVLKLFVVAGVLP